MHYHIDVDVHLCFRMKKGPRIDMTHGFVKSIQRDLTAQAMEMNLGPAKPNPQNGSQKDETQLLLKSGSAVQFRSSVAKLQSLDAGRNFCSKLSILVFYISFMIFLFMVSISSQIWILCVWEDRCNVLYSVASIPQGNDAYCVFQPNL